MRLPSQRASGVLVLVASLLALVAAGYNGYRSNAFAKCQAHYNEVNNERTRVITESADRERQADRAAEAANAALWLSPALSKPANQRTTEDQANLIRLFAAYQKALADQQAANLEADRIRAEHPVPPSPSRVCG